MVNKMEQGGGGVSECLKTVSTIDKHRLSAVNSKPISIPKPQTRYLTFKGRGLSKLVISRVIIRVTPLRALITLLLTYLLSPLPPQVGL